MAEAPRINQSGIQEPGEGESINERKGWNGMERQVTIDLVGVHLASWQEG